MNKFILKSFHIKNLFIIAIMSTSSIQAAGLSRALRNKTLSLPQKMPIRLNSNAPNLQQFHKKLLDAFDDNSPCYVPRSFIKGKRIVCLDTCTCSINEILKENPKLLETQNEQGDNSLLLATKMQKYHLVSALLNKNVRLDMHDKAGKKPLDIALSTYSLLYDNQLFSLAGGGIGCKRLYLPDDPIFTAPKKAALIAIRLTAQTLAQDDGLSQLPHPDDLSIPSSSLKIATRKDIAHRIKMIYGTAIPLAAEKKYQFKLKKENE